jgi:hypothetical protein
MAVDFAEIFFLSMGQHGFMTAGGKCEQKGEVEDGASSDYQSCEAGEFWLAGKPEDERRGERQKQAAASREESEDGERCREIHVAGNVSVPHEFIS